MKDGLPPAILRRMAGYPPFYRKVWLACARIPAGQTLSYGEVARRIGHPGAARAVGQALAANPFAPTVPCHRVIGTSGAMVGFSAPGGLRRKQALLRKEARAAGRGTPGKRMC